MQCHIGRHLFKAYSRNDLSWPTKWRDISPVTCQRKKLYLVARVLLFSIGNRRGEPSDERRISSGAHTS